ncbi:MAG: hypothetical protein KIG36_00315 [Eubacteriales bacterium]|nr:hypothetical protein [Eubacteriales bacterium]
MKKYCVVSHTHWDREWYMPFEQFRMRLVHLVDTLLEVLKDYPKFIFHLDAQTIVLEDYLEIRPEKRALLAKYIKKGNIIVGPWYMQNDFYLTSGEATVRNLLTGTRLAEQFGACGKVGYAPDQFGNISQLPQILKNFGINNFVFGRGYHDYSREIEGKTRKLDGDLPPFIVGDLAGDGIDGAKRVFKPAEFIWRGADGTECLAVCMLYWYNNAQRFSENIDHAKLVIDVNNYLFADYMTTPYMLLMNGVDHLEPQENLLPILDKLNKLLPEGEEIKQINLYDYIKMVQEYVRTNNVRMYTETGELRHGSDNEILNGTLSSRHYIKVANTVAQNRLENRLEPVYAMMNRAGLTVSSMDHMRYFWKQLLKNHPHDSICGCSRDEVHKHMEDNFERLAESSCHFLREGLLAMARHTRCADLGREDYSVMLVNTTERRVCGVAEVQLDLLRSDGIDAFELIDAKGRSVPFDVLSREDMGLSVFSEINLPGRQEITRWKLLVYAEVPAYAVVSLAVRPSAAELVRTETTAECLENEFLRLTVDRSGRVDLYDKTAGRLIENVLEVEDTGDRGDSYCYLDAGAPALTRRDMNVTVGPVLDSGAMERRVTIRYDMMLPAEFDWQKQARSLDMSHSVLSLTLRLRRGEPFAAIEYTLENHTKDHRTRILINPRVASKISTADIPFDVVSIERGSECCVSKAPVHPNTSFVTVSDGVNGLAVFTEGAVEYEHLAERGGWLAFTVVRANGRISGASTPETDEQWLVPGNQCLRTLGGRLGVMPYRGGFIEAGVLQYAKQFRNPLLAVSVNNDPCKFLGGKAAVQDSSVKEVFVRPDRFPKVRLPEGEPILKLEMADSIVVSAFKQSEDGRGFILRLVNLDAVPAKAFIAAKGYGFTDCWMSEKPIASLGRNKVELTLAPKQIRTILFR